MTDRRFETHLPSLNPMKSIFCITTSPTQANHIVDLLQAAGFHQGSISILLAHNSASPATGVETDQQTMTRIGAVDGRNILEVPRAGRFVVAGPITEAVGDATMGSIFGAICGALIGMGVPQIEAKLYQGKILFGDILLSVLTASPILAERAAEIFNSAKATDICTTGKSPAASPPESGPRLREFLGSPAAI